MSEKSARSELDLLWKNRFLTDRVSNLEKELTALEGCAERDALRITARDELIAELMVFVYDRHSQGDDDFDERYNAFEKRIEELE